MHIDSEADVDRLVHGARLVAVLAAWTELGIWEALARLTEPIALDQLSADQRALSIAAPILAHAGLLDGDGTHWMMSAVARQLYARGALPNQRNLESLGDLARISDVMRDGGPVKDAAGQPQLTCGGVRPDDRQSTRTFLDMLYRRSEDTAQATARWALPRIAAPRRVLDVGGGHGRYSHALASRGCQVTLLDLPLVVSIAEERYGNQLTYLRGNFHHDAWGGPYDAVLLSNIVHSESMADNGALVKRAFDVLDPGGVLLIKDMLIDEQGRDPETAVFFGLTMLFYTAQGRVYTRRDITSWCTAAGFVEHQVVSLQSHCLVFARRP